MHSILLSSDSYKHSHFLQYPFGTEAISSYVEARVGKEGTDQITLFLGIQAFIRQYLSEPITYSDIEEAKCLLEDHGLPFNEAGWRQVVSKHGGFLPIEIQALPEGTLVKRGTPLVQVRNTDPELPWLTSFVETALLRSIWYPSSVATLSFLAKAIIYDGLLRSSDDPEAGLPFKLHDFGARGVSSSESAALGGLAHLVNFQGTDTLEAIQAVFALYPGPQDMPGFSIPASEHSTMTSWGEAGESAAYGNMMDRFGGGLFSIVSDSYDLWFALQTIYGVTLKEKIENLEGKLIVRPDSGDPVETPLRVMRELWEAFGGTVNSKGYKVLHPKVGVIQGDGMSGPTIGALVSRMLIEGWSVDNIAFGMGGGLLQAHTRDDMRFAMKANAINFGDGWVDVQKRPATDPTKASKAGRQIVWRNAAGEICHGRDEAGVMGVSDTVLLRTVYKDGEAFFEETFDQVRARAHEELKAFHARVFPAREPEAAAA